jgi:hypothetical protein
MSDAFGDAIRTLKPDDLDRITPNGLSARDLVVHMAAQESHLAQVVGVPTLPEVEEMEVVARTDELRQRLAGRQLAEAVQLWRDAVATNCAWAVDHPDDTVQWARLSMTRDDSLVVRAFEAWIGRENGLRIRAGGLDQVGVFGDIEHAESGKPGLAEAEQIAGAAQLEVGFRDLEAVGAPDDDVESLARGVRQAGTHGHPPDDRGVRHRGGSCQTGVDRHLTGGREAGGWSTTRPPSDR